MGAVVGVVGGCEVAWVVELPRRYGRREVKCERRLW